MDFTHGVYHLSGKLVGLDSERMEGRFKENHDNDCDWNFDDYFVGFGGWIWQFIKGLTTK